MKLSRLFFITLLLACSRKEQDYFVLGELKETTTYTYKTDSNNRVISEESVNHSGGNLVDKQFSSFSYDTKGRLKTKQTGPFREGYIYNENDSLVFQYILEDTDTVFRMKKIFEGPLLTYMFQLKSGIAFDLEAGSLSEEGKDTLFCSENFYSYNKNGKEVCLRSADRKNNIITIDSSFYKNDVRDKEKHYQYEKDGTEKFTGITTYSWYPDYRLRKRARLNPDNTIQNTTEVAEETGKNKMVRHIFEKGAFVMIEVYDQKGLMIYEATSSARETSVQRFEYDNNQRVVKRELYNGKINNEKISGALSQRL